jgi:hypothetical protein
MRSLVPCTACQRHAWSSEAACPFCGGALSQARPAAAPGVRLGRAALLVAGSLGATACGPSKPPVDAPPPDGTVVALYGAPAPDPTSTGEPTEPDPGGMQPKYGAPPPPDVVPAPPPEDDPGSMRTKYGGPPPP